MGVLLQNDQPVGGISADVIETINFSDLTTTSKTLPGAINELAANPSTTESMSQAEYNALTEAEKMDGTARFVYDAISTDESELWGRVGRNTLHTDAQIISNAINEIKDTMGSGTLTTTSPTIIGGINELNSSLANLVHTQSGSGSYGVNSTLQISSDILAHNIIVICCGRYGYGNSIVLSASSISAGFYASGIGAYINSSRHVTIKVSTTGLITILETNDALNITILGIC